MPYITTTVNTDIPKQIEKELASLYGKAITAIKGKTENWLMLNFVPNSRMYFSGSDAPAAMVEIQIFGSASEDEYSKLTASICHAMTDKLGIPSDRVYVKYGELDHWGWNNVNF